MSERGDSLEKLKILVAEDDRDLQRILKISLEREGFEVLQAFTGKECLDAVRKVTPDLILLDLMMPEVGGFDVCRQLKSVNLSKDIPVIVLTAKEGLRDKKECFSFRADDYMVKPYEFEELLLRIYLHISKAVDRRREREIEMAQAVRSALEELSIAVAGAYEDVVKSLDTIKKELPPRWRHEIKRAKDRFLEAVRVVEKSRARVDPLYDSLYLEKERT